MGWTSKPPSGTSLKTGTWHTQNLVSYWSFQEGTGTYLTDIYNGNNGTLYNFADPPTSTSGWNTESSGIVLAFDGTNDYCRTDSNFAVADPVSIAMWVKWNSSTTMVLLMNKAEWNSTYGFQVFLDASKVVARGSGTSSVTTSSSFSTGVWHHIVVVYSGTNAKVYVDNVERVSGTINQINTSSQQPLYVGRYAGSSSFYFVGRVDDIRIFNRVLSTSEVSELYNDRWGIFVDPTLPMKSIAGVDISNVKRICGVGINDIKRI